MPIRQPLVAGQFYPASAQALRAEVERHLTPAEAPASALLAMVPHAGYVYSGALAGKVFAQLKVPETVLLLGPNHSGRGAAAALSGYDAWQTPLGLTPRAAELDRLLLKCCPRLKEDNLAHRHEHSLEVELPFLQVLQPGLQISAISLGHLDWPALAELGRNLAAALKAFNKPVLMVASTDMSHYLPASDTIHQDDMALKQVLDLNPEGLFAVVRARRISMCGVLAVGLGLAAALELGAALARLVGYSHSGQVSGDNQRVVGYAGVLVY